MMQVELYRYEKERERRRKQEVEKLLHGDGVRKDSQQDHGHGHFK